MKKENMTLVESITGRRYWIPDEVANHPRDFAGQVFVAHSEKTGTRVYAKIAPEMFGLGTGGIGDTVIRTVPNKKAGGKE